MDIKVGIHQPNFFPWLGYFIKMNESDKFIYLDDVEYSKSSLTRRTYIRKSDSNSEKTYLTIPLKKHSNTDKISDLIVADSKNAYDEITTKLNRIYSSAPYYNSIHNEIELILKNALDESGFSKTSIYILEELKGLLGIVTPTYIASSLDVEGRSTDYLTSMIKEIGGTIYLSGQGAKKYQDENLFHKEDIDLYYLQPMAYLCNFKDKYPQFNSGYSILDAIYYLGQEKVSQIIQDYQL